MLLWPTSCSLVGVTDMDEDGLDLADRAISTFRVWQWGSQLRCIPQPCMYQSTTNNTNPKKKTSASVETPSPHRTCANVSNTPASTSLGSSFHFASLPRRPVRPTVPKTSHREHENGIGRRSDPSPTPAPTCPSNAAPTIVTQQERRGSRSVFAISDKS